MSQHLLSDQTISSKDFAENIREYWNSGEVETTSNKLLFEQLFDSTYDYYPFGSQCFSNAEMYRMFNNDTVGSEGLLQQIESLKTTQGLSWENKRNKQFKYAQYTDCDIKLDPTFEYPTTGDPISKRLEDVTTILYMFECKEEYY